jgi:hypothetical protein
MAYTPSTDFIFTTGSYSPSNNFNFTPPGDPSGVINALVGGVTGSFVGDFVASDNITGDISATLDGLSSSFVGRYYDFGGEIIATTGDVVGGFIANYDSNILNFTTSKVCGVIESASKLLNKVETPCQQAWFNPVKIDAMQQDGTFIVPGLCFVVENGTFKDGGVYSNQDNATFIFGNTCFVQQQGTFIDTRLCLAAEQATAVHSYLCAIMEQMTKVYPNKWCAPTQDSGTSRHDILRLVYLEPDPPYDYTPSTDFTFTQNPSYTPSDDFLFDFGQTGFVVEQHVVGINSSTTCSSFTDATPKKLKRCVPIDTARKPPRGKSPWIDIPRPEPPPTPPTGTTVTVAIKEVYTMKNTISVTLQDLTPIKMDNLSLSFDVDSFAWQFSGELLDKAQLSLVKPLSNGDAVVLIVTINGVAWHVMAEKIAHNRQFGKRSITISGRGLSALLAAPYRVAGSGTQGSLLTNQQLADSHAPFGWTINWQLPTWNITGGAYSWQNRTELEAIADIADYCGGVIVPARDSQTLTIKPRYPVLPWNFAATAVDVAIPDSVITDMTYREASQKHPNGVYVHGGEIGGQLGFCRLNGTAGDVLIETTSNPLMTDVVGLRALGERLLAGQYIQPDIEQITTFMDGTIVPFIDVGTLVGITVDAVETKAIVNSVALTANNGEVFQTLTLGEQSSNRWIAFKSLLPKDPLLVGTITSTTGTTSIVSLIDGGVLNVRGTGNVNDKVYIRAGQIQGVAPNLPLNTIVI